MRERKREIGRESERERERRTKHEIRILYGHKLSRVRRNEINTSISAVTAAGVNKGLIELVVFCEDWAVS